MVLVAAVAQAMIALRSLAVVVYFCCCCGVVLGTVSLLLQLLLLVVVVVEAVAVAMCGVPSHAESRVYVRVVADLGPMNSGFVD